MWPVFKRPPLAGFERPLTQRANSRVKRDFRSDAIRVNEGGVRLLYDIIQYPDDGIAARFKRLGISVDKGNRWKEQLIENNLVRSKHITKNNSHRVSLRLTDEAHLLLLPHKDGLDPQASCLHEYCKRRVAYQFEREGYKVKLEVERKAGGGKMDISATRGSESVAIEIETGKSDVISNVKRDLLCGVQKVIVIATDEKALEKVEKQLAKAGLLLPERVEVALCKSTDRIC